MRTTLLASSLSLFLLVTAASLPAQVLRGAEIQVPSRAAAAPSVGDVAVAADGHFVVVWSQTENGRSRALLRSFDAAGRPLGEPSGVASVLHGEQRAPRIALAADGRFVVVWQSAGRVWGRRFDPSGRPLARRFPLAEQAAGLQDSPDVAIAPNGRFLVAWSEVHGLDDELVPHTEIWARWFEADESAVAPPFPVTAGFSQADLPRLAINGPGGVAVVFQAYGGEGLFWDIYLQRYRADGSARGPLVRVDTDVDLEGTSQIEPSVVLADDGRCLVAWTDFGGDFLAHPNLPSQDVRGARARLFRVDGTPATPSFALNSFFRGDQEQPSVALTKNGGFLVTWTTGGNQDGDGTGLFARYLGVGGDLQGAEFRINLGRKGNQDHPVLATSANGWGVVAWTSRTGDPATSGIYARRFEP